jgi:hypothetical protein
LIDLWERAQRRRTPYQEKRQAIDYAETRACFRSGEIRILDSAGAIPFDETNRSL